MFSVAKRINEFIKDLTTLSILTGVLALIKLLSSLSKFLGSKHPMKAGKELRF